jgi:hypothetical protein
MYIGIGAIVIIVIIVLVILMLRRLCCADAPEPTGQDRPGGLPMEDQVGAPGCIDDQRPARRLQTSVIDLDIGADT